MTRGKPAGRRQAAELEDPMDGGGLKRFFNGFAFPFRGVGLLTSDHRNWGLALIPMLLTLVLLVAAVWIAVDNTPWVLSMLWEKPATTGGLQMLLLGFWYLTGVFLGLFLVTTGFVAVYALVALVATPFNDMLSERIEVSLLGSVNESFSIKVFLRDTGVSIAHSLLDMLLWIALILPLLVLNFLPLVGTLLFSVLSGLATVFFLAKDMLDGPMTRRRFSYAEKVAVVRSDLPLMGGFGAATAVLLWVPVVNLFLVPVAVAGGTALFCHLEANGRIVFSDRRSGEREAPAPSRVSSQP